MPITIEAPTAEAALQALTQLPESELARLRELLTAVPLQNGDDYSTDPTYSSEWSEEDIEDFRRSTALLIEKRLGDEEVDYD